MSKVMLCGSSFAPSFNRASPFFSYFTKIPSMLIFKNNWQTFCNRFAHNQTYLLPKPVIQACHFSRDRRANLCTVALSATPQVHDSAALATNNASYRAKKKALRESPERVLQVKLDQCSKWGDVVEALRLYDEARSNGIQLNQHHYNVLLYVCSSGSPVEVNGDGASARTSDLYFKRGFEIFQQMIIDKVAPNEATFTNAARLALGMEDPDMAFDLVKQMKGFDIPPKLRTYAPALFGFCKKGRADRAYEVDAHMAESGVMPEDPELSALLKVSAEVKRPDKVYETLHRLRAIVRQVTDSTLGVIEDWFKSEDASKVGKENWDTSKVKEAVERGGGGWHRQGWLGSGPWRVVRTEIDEKGVCQSCSEKLVCIDIDPKETENFAASLSDLAFKKEVKTEFVHFQEWLQQHGPFDAVIDGANVGLVYRKAFRFDQLNSVVVKLRQISRTKKLPLIVLHQSRIRHLTRGAPQNARNKKYLDFWKKSGALYATPVGSNDDWYWLYAAVSNNCLVMTNDEMRDHIFQLLGTSFFPRWKEKHQVRLSVSSNGLALQMPPPYSIVIQESENGNWHVPTTTEDDLKTPRQWLCANRASNNQHSL